MFRCFLPCSLALTPDIAGEVLFQTTNGMRRAFAVRTGRASREAFPKTCLFAHTAFSFQAAQRTKSGGKFANCHELSVPLGDLDLTRQEVLSKWQWNEEDRERQPVNDERQPHPVDGVPVPIDTVMMVPTMNNGKDANMDNIDALAVDELDAYLESGALPATSKASQSRPQPTDPQPHDPASTSERPPRRTSSNAIPVGPPRSTQRETLTSTHPSMSSTNQRASNSLKRAKPKSSALAFLMSQQPEMEPLDGSIDSPITDEAGSAKKRRFE